MRTTALALLILAACRSDGSPPETGFIPGGDGGSNDGGASDGDGGSGDGGGDDADADGYDSDVDCDDTDDSIHPGAYDRPNDGIDQDCADGDRSFDGLVLDPGDTASIELEVQNRSAVPLDVALVVDTSCSGAGPLSDLDVPDLHAQLGREVPDFNVGFATFEDYVFGTGGSAQMGDLPFRMDHQLTRSKTSVQDAIEAAQIGGGGDSVESAYEALYQALTGQGYDTNCDGILDPSTDVPPFVATTDDAFGGASTATYDPAVSGTGDLGGMGFRADALRTVVLVLDSEIRSSSRGDATPGGCSLDAGLDDVLDAADALEAAIMVVATGPDDHGDFAALAVGSGAVADRDSSGVPVPLVYENTTWSLVNGRIFLLLYDFAREHGVSGHTDRLTMDEASDPDGFLISISPAAHEDLDAEEVVAFDLSLVGALAATDEVQHRTVEVEARADGQLLDSWTIEIEVPPAGSGD